MAKIVLFGPLSLLFLIMALSKTKRKLKEKKNIIFSFVTRGLIVNLWVLVLIVECTLILLKLYHPNVFLKVTRSAVQTVANNVNIEIEKKSKKRFPAETHIGQIEMSESVLS